MDFAFNDIQVSISDLAERILANAVDQSGVEGSLDRLSWKQFAEAGLIGLGVSETQGGSAFGLIELCIVLKNQGKFLTPLPYLQTAALVAPLIDKFGSGEQKKNWLPQIIAGECIVAIVLSHFENEISHQSDLTVIKTASGWSLDGTCYNVPYAHEADLILVPASVDTNTHFFLLDPGESSLSFATEETTSGQPQTSIAFKNTQLGEQAELDKNKSQEIWAWLEATSLVAQCALQLGIAEEALQRTAAYVSERKQFGQPLGGFQAVSQRLANGYIDVEAMRATLWQAAWRLDNNLPAQTEIHTAKYWAALGGHRIAQSAQHLHGGIGADRDYPIHRYFLWAKQCEFALGGHNYHLMRLGKEIAKNQ